MNFAIELKEVEFSHIPIIRELARVCFFETYRDILSSDQINYMYDWMYSETSLENQIKSGHKFVLAYHDNECVGYVSYQFESPTTTHLHKLYLSTDFQGKGLGKLLINYVFAKAKEYSRGETCRVDLNVNRENKAYYFYKKMGMIEVGSGDFPIGEGYYMCDYIMRKVL